MSSFFSSSKVDHQLPITLGLQRTALLPTVIPPLAVPSTPLNYFSFKLYFSNRVKGARLVISPLDSALTLGPSVELETSSRADPDLPPRLYTIEPSNWVSFSISTLNE